MSCAGGAGSSGGGDDEQQARNRQDKRRLSTHHTPSLRLDPRHSPPCQPAYTDHVDPPTALWAFGHPR